LTLRYFSGTSQVLLRYFSVLAWGCNVDEYIDTHVSCSINWHMDWHKCWRKYWIILSYTHNFSDVCPDIWTLHRLAFVFLCRDCNIDQRTYYLNWHKKWYTFELHTEVDRGLHRWLIDIDTGRYRSIQKMLDSFGHAPDHGAMAPSC
jgi:hypothetical protein